MYSCVFSWLVLEHPHLEQTRQRMQQEKCVCVCVGGGAGGGGGGKDGGCKKKGKGGREDVHVEDE